MRVQVKVALEVPKGTLGRDELVTLVYSIMENAIFVSDDERISALKVLKVDSGSWSQEGLEWVNVPKGGSSD